MSAWVIALGLSAGYLINKNLTMTNRLMESVTKSNAAAAPASGLQSSTIRQVQRTVPDADKYQDMNLQDLPAKDVKQLTKNVEAAHQEVQEFEVPVQFPEIQGVYLSGDRSF